METTGSSIENREIAVVLIGDSIYYEYIILIILIRLHNHQLIL
jgi:hypothetical protein